MLRRRLSAADPGQFRSHDHVACCGDGAGALDEAAVAAFAGAAERGELMIFVDDPPRPERLAALKDLRALMDRGALRLSTRAAAYGGCSDLAAQRAYFEDVCDWALADGFAGMCVVADCSHFASAGEEEFASWLAWEVVADRFQAYRPVQGVCYFDRRRVPSDRLADLALLHPVLSAGFESPPSFQLFADGDAVRVAGALDYFHADQLQRILSSVPALTGQILDLSETEYVHHRAPLILSQLATDGHPVRLRGVSPIVRKMWDLLGSTSQRLVFC